MTFEGVGFKGVFRVEGVSGMLLWLAVVHNWFRFEWVLLRKRERPRNNPMGKLFEQALLTQSMG